MNVRTLSPADVRAFRRFRLAALRTTRNKFGPTYLDETAQPLDWWKQRLEATRRQTWFGLFADTDKMVGVSMAYRHEPDRSGKTVRWGGSFILRGQQGKGLASSLYEARRAWSEAQGYPVAVMSIHAANTHCWRIHEARGAVCTGSRIERHSDRGPAARWKWYRVDLHPPELRAG